MSGLLPFSCIDIIMYGKGYFGKSLRARAAHPISHLPFSHWSRQHRNRDNAFHRKVWGFIFQEQNKLFCWLIRMMTRWDIGKLQLFISITSWFIMTDKNWPSRVVTGAQLVMTVLIVRHSLHNYSPALIRRGRGRDDWRQTVAPPPLPPPRPPSLYFNLGSLVVRPRLARRDITTAGPSQTLQ